MAKNLWADKWPFDKILAICSLVEWIIGFTRSQQFLLTFEYLQSKIGLWRAFCPHLTTRQEAVTEGCVLLVLLLQLNSRRPAVHNLVTPADSGPVKNVKKIYGPAT